MKSKVCQSKSYNISHLISWFQKVFGEGGSTHVLHSDYSEFRAKDLVIFGKRKLNTEELFIKGYASLNHSEKFLGIKKMSLTLAYKDSHWNLRIHTLIFEYLEMTSEEPKDISTYKRSLLKGMQNCIHGIIKIVNKRYRIEFFQNSYSLSFFQSVD